MFYKEYKVASCIGELLKERLQIEIDEHEIGYLALHVHSAIVEENVSQAMEVARAVRESISLVENGHNLVRGGKTIGWVPGKHMMEQTRNEYQDVIPEKFEKLCDETLRRHDL